MRGESFVSSPKLVMTVFFAIQAVAPSALSADRPGTHDVLTVPADPTHARRATAKEAQTAVPLDRVASAVDGAESSHGQDIAMWRPEPSGPQGPMQVSEAAAADVGGGDRFDLLQNRVIGRAYLQQLFWRYRNWPDAIAAYNWGIGKMDAWIKAGRPPEQFLVGVAVYQRRVLHESGLCNNADDGRRRVLSLPRQAPGRPAGLCCLLPTRRMGRCHRLRRPTNSTFEKTGRGADPGVAARGTGPMTRCQASSKPAMRRAMFHMSSDSAKFDNIAVPSGSGSADRLVTTCSIGLPSQPLSAKTAQMLIANRVP